MDTAPISVIAMEAVATIVCFVLGVVLLRVARAQANHTVGVVLMFEAATQAGWTLADLSISRGNIAVADIFIAGALLVFAAAGPVYLLIVRRLETPWVRPLRLPYVLPTIAAVIGGLGLFAAAYMVLHRGEFNLWAGPIEPGFQRTIAILATPIAAITLYSLVSAISAWRRAVKGSLQRSRARAYALAFGTRDAVYVLAMVLNIGVVGVLGAEGWNEYTYPLWSTGPLVFAILLTYGILRTQLFDLDLKIKSGISKSTVVAIAIIAVFMAAKAAETYLNKNVGFVAGSAAAGLLLFMAPRLNKLGDKVANAALPQVQPTQQYVSFKKLEVYKAAVEAANETGGITDKDRLALDRLRTKLALDAADAQAVEAEVLPSPAQPAQTTVGA